MSRYGKLITLVRVGAFLMALGNALVTWLQFEDSHWKYSVYIFPANLGQGIVYPGLLFTSLATFDHRGKYHVAAYLCRIITDNISGRPRRNCIDCLSHKIPRNRLGRGDYFCNSTDYSERPASGCSQRCTRQMESTTLSIHVIFTCLVVTMVTDDLNLADYRLHPTLGGCAQGAPARHPAQSPGCLLPRNPVLVCRVDGHCAHCIRDLPVCERKGLPQVDELTPTRSASPSSMQHSHALVTGLCKSVQVGNIEVSRYFPPFS
jgi:hypothetical protein